MSSSAQHINHQSTTYSQSDLARLARDTQSVINHLTEVFRTNSHDSQLIELQSKLPRLHQLADNSNNRHISERFNDLMLEKQKLEEDLQLFLSTRSASSSCSIM